MRILLPLGTSRYSCHPSMVLARLVCHMVARTAYRGVPEGSTRKLSDHVANCNPVCVEYNLSQDAPHGYQLGSRSIDFRLLACFRRCKET